MERGGRILLLRTLVLDKMTHFLDIAKGNGE